MAVAEKSADPYNSSRTWRSPGFDVLSFLVSHLFIYPVPLLCAGVYAIVYGSTAAKAVSLACLVGYTATMFDKAQFTGARAWMAFRRPWLGCHAYFPIVTKMFDGQGYSSAPCDGHSRTYDVARRPFVFGMHPHGPLPLGGAVFPVQLTRWPDISAKLRCGVASVVFWVPLVRDFYLWFGGVDVGRKTLQRVLSHGESVLVLPGGIREQLWVCPPDEEVVVLRGRKGFVRLALQNGAPLVPVFVFGERQAFRTSYWLNRVVSGLLKRTLGIGLPLVWGRFGTLMPFPGLITIVVGRPIDVGPAVSEPNDALIESTHARYCEALAALYEEHKVAAGYGHMRLCIR